MKVKKRFVALVAAIGIAVGWLTLGGTAAVMHATSSTEFCVSCHSMQIAYEEYEGSVHFSNAKGIRAECADCHIPNDPIGYVFTKIRATKDIYHEFVTGKIDTEDKYEEHRMAMAETVWAQLRENDSATCRSCHTNEAMDLYSQTEEAAKMHEYGVENNQTCIDCHKGVAHFAPEPEMDSAAFDQLFALADNTPKNASTVYPIQPIALADLGEVNPTTEMTVISETNGNRTVEISGYQMKGAERVLYMGNGQRAIIATLNDAGQAAVEAGEFAADEYGNEWRTAKITGTVDSPVLDSLDPMWEYAEQLDNVYCATCHAKIAAGHFTVNAWGPVAKGMGDRTDISELDLEILTKYFQHHAKDVAGH
ncbi:NapC/NirT family cytochrome c [Enterovibrio coralii]|uniref:Cytochrome c-type protein n=1 Tax=Enterovibrio coralii TaxID=294935 RepID=A0A135IA02_9GAMM|nr:NapC/NirT family cytochrome c [Enterovibrio coralii]KXF82279.1 cytochrome C [Enterovibrio coralii]